MEFVQNATEFVFEEGAQQLICVYTEANFSQRLQRYIAVNFNITPITASKTKMKLILHLDVCTEYFTVESREGSTWLTFSYVQLALFAVQQRWRHEE